MISSAAFGLLFFATATAPAVTPATADVPSAQAAPTAGEAPTIDVTAPDPPPSTYDRQLQQEAAEEGEAPPAPGEDFSVWGQLVQTTIALFVVVGLIYLLGRTVLPRLAGIRIGGTGGRMLEVLERLQLDNRHTLMIVRVQDDRTMLLSVGEGGVRLVADLSADAASSGATSGPDREGFKVALARAAASAAPTAPDTATGPDGRDHG